jgi:hypothetical protein
MDGSESRDLKRVHSVMAILSHEIMTASKSSRSATWSATCLVGILLAAGRVHANGAFPDSLQVLLPADRPHEIILATNFGLISSQDDGQTWLWSCEQPLTNLAGLYQVGAPPQDRVYALSRAGLVYSEDDTCSWSVARGSLATALATDAFPDPRNPSRVFAIANQRGDASTPQSLYLSSDGGLTFGAPLFSAPLDGGLLGVESAASDPMTIYLSTYRQPGIHPQLMRSTDGGAQWMTIEVESTLGANGFRIVAVDPQDPLQLYLRVIEDLGEELAVSSDGGVTLRKPASTDGRFTAFARLASGTVLVGALSNGEAQGFRSTDRGLTFQPWVNPPHLRALAERDGKLFAAADNFKDGFALAVSTDEGLTFRPLMRFDQVTGINPCVQELCADPCDYQAGIKLWAPEVCQPRKQLSDASAGDGQRPAPPVNRVGIGCGCRAAGNFRPWWPISVALGLVFAIWLRSRSRGA